MPFWCYREPQGGVGNKGGGGNTGIGVGNEGEKETSSHFSHLDLLIRGWKSEEIKIQTLFVILHYDVAYVIIE